MSNRTHALLALTTSLLLVGAAACGSSDGDPSADAGMDDAASGCMKSPPSRPAAHACWHVCADTPAQVAASATSEDASNAEAVSFGATYRISLKETDDGDYSGVVRFDASTAIAGGSSKDIHVFTVRSLPFGIRPVSEGTADPVGPNSTGTIECDQGLGFESVFEMTSQEYAIEIGPTSEQIVTLVLVPLNGPDNA